MENASIEKEAEGTSKQKTKRARSSKASKRPRATSQPSVSTTQLMKRGRNLVKRAEGLASSASGLTTPIADLGSNAFVMGVLGLGIGVAVGALLPQVALPEMSALTRQSRVRKKARRG